MRFSNTAHPFELLSNSQEFLPDDVFSIAREFLYSNYFILETGAKMFRYWKSRYLKHDGKCYSRVPDDDLKALIVGWLQQYPEMKDQIKTEFLKNIILNIQGMTHLSFESQLNTWLNGKSKSIHFIPLQNGILDVTEFIEGKVDALLSHTPDFFSMNCLPFSFDQTATCPIWKKVLFEIQPNVEVQELIQEWIGYNLISDTTQQKFMLFLGEGANGKSVILSIMAALLGDQNISSVGLEGFNPSRTFMLAATVGKLANICAEINAAGRPAEGLLKQYVGGDSLTLEEKHKPAFTCKPTARLTFASNILPQFSDQSDGVWRRLILVPFDRRFSEEEQDKRLASAQFWQDSGELPGIFNWALDGLVRLLQRGAFAIPDTCKAVIKDYREQCNPAKVFLEDHYEEDSSSSLPRKGIYRHYSQEMQDLGFVPLSEARFAEDVHRTFLKVIKSKNAISFHNGRHRAWIGLRRKD